MYPLILSIAGALIIILLGIIGYYIVKDNKNQGCTNNELFESLEKLNGSISGLNAVLLVMQERHESLEKRFNEHKEVCREKFKDIG